MCLSMLGVQHLQKFIPHFIPLDLWDKQYLQVSIYRHTSKNIGWLYV